MSDYIEREAVLDAIERMKPFQQDADDIAEMLQNFPAADVRPVVRGRWEEFGEAKQKFYSCSNCFATHYRWDNFCPNCGAKMEEA